MNNHNKKKSNNAKRAYFIKLQNYKCGICENLIKGGNFEIDHLVPTAYGGVNDDFNLICMCPNCHSLKTKMVDRNIKFIILDNPTGFCRIKLIKYIKYTIKYANTYNQFYNESSKN